MLHESNSEKTHDSDGAGGQEVARLVSERLAILQQLWRELGVAPDEQAREQQTLVRDVRGVYDRRLQFYRDEQELTRRRLAVLQREIAHVQWLFRDDAPHEFGDGQVATSLRDELASLEVTFKCLDQIRVSRSERLAALDAELTQLLHRVGEERQSVENDQDENLSESKIQSLEARIERLRPLVEALARKTLENATRCAEILLTLEVSAYSDFDATLLHYSEDTNLTPEITTKVAERVNELETALEEARALCKRIVKREAIIWERLEYDQSANDSQRLTSRTREAGRLLREERLRKVIRKDLPKLTKYLEKHIKMWEQKHAMEFVWKGHAYLSHMHAVDRAYEERSTLLKAEKEKERENRARMAVARASSSRLSGQDENKPPTRLRRRNSMVSESSPAAEAPKAAPPPPRPRRFSAQCSDIESVRNLSLASP